jgi:hypothetical protein
MTTAEENEMLSVLQAYIKEWGTKPTAVEIAGYETPEGIHSPYMMSTMMAAQNLRKLHRRGLVARWKTDWGFIYAPSEIA